MESLLVIVTLVSLALGTVMSVVAWRLLKDNRDRSAARVDALQARARLEEPVNAPPARAAALFDQPFRRVPDDEPVSDDRRDLLRPTPRTPQSLPDAGALMFAGGQQPSAGGRRGFALAVVGLLMAGVVASVYAFNTWDVVGAIARAVPQASGQDQPLELLSLRHSADESGTFTVTGLVQNPHGGRQLRAVVAVVYVFDQQNRFLSSGRTPLDVASFHPGDESPFVVKIPNASVITRYRVGFRFEDGGVVAHVDRRGHVPGGTTEDAVDGQPGRQDVNPMLPVRRSEGRP